MHAVIQFYIKWMKPSWPNFVNINKRFTFLQSLSWSQIVITSACQSGLPGGWIKIENMTLSKYKMVKDIEKPTGIYYNIAVKSWCKSYLTSSSSCMRSMRHNWSATKQRPHPQSVAEISRHSLLSGDRIRQCKTSSGSRHKDTDQCL